MAKRRYARRRGEAVDDYEDPPGRKVTHVLPQVMLGEVLSDDERDAAIAAAASARGSSYPLRGDASPEVLDALLEGLQRFNWSAPMALLNFLDDPRVQPALVEAAGHCDASELANIAQVCGFVGGPRAREVLTARVEELAALTETFADHAFFNDKAGALATASRALLGLQPDADLAADALLRLFDHPCAFNRRSAFSLATSLVRRSSATSTSAIRRLTLALRAAEDDADDELFLILLPARRPGDMSYRPRLERMLAHDDIDIRQRSIGDFSQAHILSAWSLARLRDRLADEPSLRLRLQIAATLGPLLDERELARHVTEALEDESPSLRHAAIGLLRCLPIAVATELAERALVDEPDPALARMLRERGARSDDA